MALDTTNALTDLATAKPYLRIAADDTTYDTVLEILIDGLSHEFNKYTRRDLVARDRTDYYDGPNGGGDLLLLHNYPINSITTLNVDTGRDFDSGDDIDSADYAYSKDAGWIELSGGFPDGVLKSIKVVFNAGWSLADMPKDILRAFYDELKRYWTRWFHNDEGKRSVNREAVNEDFEDPNSVLLTARGTFFDLSTQAMAVLERYKRRGLTGGATT